MKKISINNGHSYTTPREAIKAAGMDTIAHMMDDEIREHVAHKYAPIPKNSNRPRVAG